MSEPSKDDNVDKTGLYSVAQLKAKALPAKNMIVSGRVREQNSLPSGRSGRLYMIELVDGKLAEFHLTGGQISESEVSKLQVGDFVHLHRVSIYHAAHASVKIYPLASKTMIIWLRDGKLGSIGAKPTKAQTTAFSVSLVTYEEMFDKVDRNAPAVAAKTPSGSASQVSQSSQTTGPVQTLDQAIELVSSKPDRTEIRAGPFILEIQSEVFRTEAKSEYEAVDSTGSARISFYDNTAGVLNIESGKKYKFPKLRLHWFDSCINARIGQYDVVGVEEIPVETEDSGDNAIEVPSAASQYVDEDDFAKQFGVYSQDY